MPELPEVETIKNDLKKAILGKEIVGVEARDKKAVRNGLGDFLKALKGNSFADIDRVGKLLIFELKDGKYLLIHLKLTGQLIYVPYHFLSESPPTLSFVRRGRLNPPIPPLTKGAGIIAGGHPFPEVAAYPTKSRTFQPDAQSSQKYFSRNFLHQQQAMENGKKVRDKFTRAVFKFEDGSKLYFNDMRRFGYLKIADENELQKIKEEYGIDPMDKDFQYENFKNIFQNKKISVKAVLMDQKLIAGIGNIYSDEILFASQVRPTRSASSLEEKEIKKIFSVIRPILKRAIRHRGTSFSDYVDGGGRRGGFASFLKIYGKKAGEKCSSCGGPVKAVKISGRSAKFCPKCQN